MHKHIFTSESVTEGHPDKICDQISDAVLDEVFKKDPNGRVACEALASTNLIVIAGEITTRAKINPEKIARNVLKEIGYNNAEWGIDYKTCKVLDFLKPQSLDIAQGVLKEDEDDPYECIGAGDQGMMFGFACKETPEFMPLPISLAHKITEKLTEVRKSKKISWLRPDGKSQVSVEYLNNKPSRIDTIIVSTQHEDGISHKEIEKEIKEKIIYPVLPKKFLKDDIKFYINPSGRFVCGGPHADAGLTGRKIIVDTYGGYARHGGGAFSGKDPTKVDRSGAYMARYVAKNIVANNLASIAEVQIAYAIGVSKPVSVLVETFGTSNVPEDKLINIVKSNFDLRPAAIIETLNLRRPIYRKVAAYGHFGRNTLDLPWEKVIKLNLSSKAKASK